VRRASALTVLVRDQTSDTVREAPDVAVALDAMYLHSTRPTPTPTPTDP